MDARFRTERWRLAGGAWKPSASFFRLSLQSRVSFSSRFVIGAFALRFATFHILFTVNYVAKICRLLK